MKDLPSNADIERWRGSLYRCRRCHAGFRHPCAQPGEMRALYGALEGGLMQYPYESNSAWVEARKALMNRFGEEDKPSVLDIGCYDGQFLKGLPQNWIRCGVEPGESAQAELADAKITVLGSFIEDIGEQWQGCFDAVFLFDVLEHLHDPVGALDLSLRLLKKEGVLLISTGDLDSWPMRNLLGNHGYFESPQHINVFSRRFFDWFCHERGSARLRSTSISHRRSGMRREIEEAVAAAYFILKQRGGWWRIPHRVIQELPGWRWLRHKKVAPATFCVKDHLFLEIENTSRMPSKAWAQESGGES